MKNNLYIYALSAYMFLLGSHLLVHYLWIFILPALFLIDWKKKFPIEIYFLLFFLVSLYGVYIYGHRGIFHDSKWAIGVIVEIVMIFLVYLLGISPKNIGTENISNDRKIFYLLYGFFIAYILGIVYSYYFLPQNNPLNSRGFRVYYTNVHDFHVHGDGQLVATIVAYFLSFLIGLLPFILFNFKKLRERKFTLLELFLFAIIGLFSFYLAAGLGRRIVVLIGIVFFIYFGIQFLLMAVKNNQWWKFVLTTSMLMILFFIAFYSVQDSLVMQRIKAYHGFTDPRYLYWLSGLEYMWQYPFGGAAKLPIVFKINPSVYLKGVSELSIMHGIDPNAHNFWINIGKYYGVAAFVASILFYFIHIKYFVRIMFNKSISLFMKNLIFIIAFVLFANMMVESIFHTEKSLFFYSLFFLGFMKFYSDTYSDIEKSATAS